MENQVKRKQKIKCACGEEFDTKKSFVLHILTLGCFDENLVLKDENSNIIPKEIKG